MGAQMSHSVDREHRLAPRYAVATSPGIRRIRHLAELLGVDQVLSATQARRKDSDDGVVLAWGRKPSAARAINFARDSRRKVWFLEDGFIRSAQRDAHGCSPYSLIVDPEGIYYDGSVPSGIERFLNRSQAEFLGEVDAEAMHEAGVLRQRMVEHDITKYNYCKTPDLGDTSRPLVLVVDQTLDDASVRYGGMDRDRFIGMLKCAVAENPEARVVVRTHPDVVRGRKRGYLDRYAVEHGIELSAATDNPLPWLKQAERVYVGTSQLGYEALLCECPVSVFGMPFYAGWGLTDDRQAIERRSHERSIDEMFYTTHMRFARYASPVTGEPWSLSDCISHVVLQKRTFERNAFRFQCVGITPWKRRYIQQYLRSPDGEVSFSRRQPDVSNSRRVCWGYRRMPEAWSSEGETEVWRMEDGFLRSAGLGSDFTAPGSLVVDQRGLYLDPRSGSDLELALNTRDCSPADITRARRLRERLLALGLSKYNVTRTDGQRSAEDIRRSMTLDKRRLLVVGQVEDDVSVIRGTNKVTTNADLLRAVRKRYPDGWIVYRPHPDVVAGNRRGVVDQETLLSVVDELDPGDPVTVALEACDELHTMTSLTGFEALLRNKPVVTWGSPFYAGWGLTDDIEVCEARKRVRTLDELVYFALIDYPRYVDIDSGEFIEVECFVDSLERAVERREQSTVGRLPKNIMRLSNAVRGLVYAP